MIRREHRPPAYVLGVSSTGLAIVRALGRQGIPVVGLHHDPQEPAIRSRYCRVQLLPRLQDDEGAWLECLLQEGRNLQPQRGVLFPTSDATWLFLVDHRGALEPYFNFALPGTGDLQAWPGKPFQYEAAAKLGVPTPWTVFPNTDGEAESAARSFAYPCLVKPVYSHLWARVNLDGKPSYVRTPEALLARYRLGREHGPQIMVTEYIPGGDDEIYGLFSYLDKQSRPLGFCVARKLRQYPPWLGSGCLSVSVREPQLMATGLHLVQTMKFHGISSIEFKRDPRDHTFKLMEINLRSPLMMAVVIDGGVNLPYIAYRDLCGVPPRPPAQFHSRRKLVYFDRDYLTFLYYRRIGILTLGQWLVSFFGRTRDIYFAWSDLAPFLAYARKCLWSFRHDRYRHKFERLVATHPYLQDGLGSGESIRSPVPRRE